MAGMIEPIACTREQPGYPGELERYLEREAPTTLWMVGDTGILDRPGTALFCSRRCTGLAATKTFDVAQQLRDAGVTVLGGFHSPLEQECLRLLLKSPHPVVVGWGRSLVGARLPPAYRRPLGEGRLLLVSACGEAVRRVTRESARLRNRVLAALADRVLVTSAEAGSETARLCRCVIAWGKPLFCLDGPAGQPVRDLGARPIHSGWLDRA